jgi:hypothetical protein
MRLSDYTDMRSIFCSVDLCTMSLVAYFHASRHELLLDTHDIFRLPQHVYRVLGESDGPYFVHVNDNRRQPYSSSFNAGPSAR